MKAVLGLSMLPFHLTYNLNYLIIYRHAYLILKGLVTKLIKKKTGKCMSYVHLINVLTAFNLIHKNDFSPIV